MKKAKLDQECDITFVHIRGKDNILTDAISRLRTNNIHEDPVENKPQHLFTSQGTVHSSKVAEDIQLLDSGTPPQLLNINAVML